MRKLKYCPHCGGRLADKFVEGRTRRFCASCNAPFYENPIPAACIVAVDPRDRVLLVKRSIEPKRGCWCLPGGFMELRETPEEAGLRELREETGIVGKIDTLLGVLSNKGTFYDTILMIGFLVRRFSGTPAAGDDAAAVEWFAREALPEIAFKRHRSFINIYYAAYAHSLPPNP